MEDGHDHRLHFVQTVPLFAHLPEESQHRVASAAVTRGYQRGERTAPVCSSSTADW